MQNCHDQQDKELREIAEGLVPTMLSSPQELGPDADIARFIAAWRAPPNPTRTAMLALLDAASSVPSADAPG